MTMAIDLCAAPLRITGGDEPTAVLRVDAHVYSVGAVLAATYVFLDRCFLHVDREEGAYVITLRARAAGAAPSLVRQLAGELQNELLAAASRLSLTQRNKKTIDAVTRELFASALGPPSIDDLLAVQDEDDPFDDPLGITSPSGPTDAKRA